MHMFSGMPTTDEQQQADDLLPISKAAALLGVSVDTVRRWERAGHITSARTLGNQRRYSRSEVERVRAAYQTSGSQ